MDNGHLFEPTLSAYLGYCAGFCLRYFTIAGLVYWVLYVALATRSRPYRIRENPPSRRQISHEIRWSMSNTLCTGLSTLLLYWLLREGRTSMYFEASAYGWPYFALSIAIAIVGYDAWFYWQHRLLHTPWLFRHVHSVHHRARNPTAFGAFAHHPVETFMGNAYFLLLLTLVPLHPLAVGAAGIYIFAAAIVSHMGYEFYPRGFTRHGLLRWWNTSTHHNMHHRYGTSNFSILFNHWDRLAGTNHQRYHDVFDDIKVRVGLVRPRRARA